MFDMRGHCEYVLTITEETDVVLSIPVFEDIDRSTFTYMNFLLITIEFFFLFIDGQQLPHQEIGYKTFLERKDSYLNVFK